MKAINTELVDHGKDIVDLMAATEMERYPENGDRGAKLSDILPLDLMSASFSKAFLYAL